jgi:hypothetical protein
MRLTVFFLVFYSIVSCSDHGYQERNLQDNEMYYVIDQPYLEQNPDSIENDSIMFFTEFYFEYNILLIDTLSAIYYYKMPFYCLTGREIWNELKPYYVGMNPEWFRQSVRVDNIISVIIQDSTESINTYLASYADIGIRSTRLDIQNG